MSDLTPSFLHLRQEQRQIISAAQLQSLTLLTMAAQELSDFLQQQLLENPVLEQDEQADNDNVPIDDLPLPDGAEDWREPGALSPARAEVYAEDRNAAFAQEDEDLPRMLLLQLELRRRHDAEESAALRAIIYSLDENAYLRVSLEDLAARFGIALPLLEKALAEVQTLEPAGIGARDLAECLRLQIPAMHPERQLLQAMIDGYLPALAAGRVKEAAHGLGISEKKAVQLFEYIRQLDPRPGAAVFPVERPQYIIPDIYVRKLDGVYRVFLNEAHQPRLRINEYYRDLLQRRGFADDAVTRVYTRQKIAEAAMLLRNIQRRRETVLCIAELIVAHQTPFFEEGLSALRPLTLREIAAAAEMHESTVCRAIGGKYMDTPRGVFSMKFFFPRAYRRDDGSMIANTCVRSRIAAYVTAEDKKKPLTDREICDLLAGEGLQVARRTVAKYREEMGIPCRAYRRRHG